MDIEDIRAIPVTELLARLGHEPKRQRGDECWYTSPLTVRNGSPRFR